MKKGDHYVARDFEGIIRATAKWSSKTDYDLYAIILNKDGSTEHVATFGARGVSASAHSHDYSVIHMGDAGRGQGDSGEEMHLTMHEDIDAVLFVVYSAQSNGAGSFRRYGVEFRLDLGDETIFIPSDEANADDGIYTMAPALIENTEEGPRIAALSNIYSRGGENRPELKRTKPTLWGRADGGKLDVSFDTGPRNDWK